MVEHDLQPANQHYERLFQEPELLGPDDLDTREDGREQDTYRLHSSDEETM